MIVVRSCPSCLMLFIMSDSVLLSREDVGSSHRRIGASFNIARAIATRCNEKKSAKNVSLGARNH